MHGHCLLNPTITSVKNAPVFYFIHMAQPPVKTACTIDHTTMYVAMAFCKLCSIGSYG